MPADGQTIATYLLERMVAGASLVENSPAAAAIQQAYVEQGQYLDPRPLKGALAMAAAQLDPARVVH